MSERERLERKGFDGLYYPGQPCGCFNDDLYPCGERPSECRPGLEADGPNGFGIYPRRFVVALRRAMKHLETR